MCGRPRECVDAESDTEEAGVAERQVWSPEDFWQVRLLSEMRLSPDGRQVAYTVDTQDRQQNERRSAIWLLDVESGESRQFTAGTTRDFAPRWSPDGTRLAFLSTRGGEKAQLFVVALDGGEARQLTAMRYGAGDPFWSGDSTWIGFEAEVREGETPVDDAQKDSATREREREEKADKPRIITRLQYRWDGKGYFEGRTHLFRVGLEGGAPEQLTEGDYDDGDGVSSPDGRFVAFLSDRADDRDANMTNDLWLLDLASRDVRRLTSAGFAHSYPAWSPDGSRIAVIAEPEIRDHAVYNETIRAIDVATGEISDLLGGRDISAGVGLYSDLPGTALTGPKWSADGTAITFLAQRGGGVDVLRVPVAGGAEPQRVLRAEYGEHMHIYDVALSGERLVLAASTPARLPDIYLSDAHAGGEHPRPLTDLNAELLASRPIASPERFAAPSFDGQQIESWLYRPTAGAESGAITPLAVWVHGGPHAAYGQSFFLLAQIFAARGYAVLYANPRGSTGYGEAFAQACDRDWGGGDYRDVLTAMDAAVARGGIDPDRVAIFGTSYGGYMTNWAVTQTERFKAAVTINSVTNLYTSFGTGDIDSVWAQGDYGWPWENQQFYLDRSPVMHAARVTTPIRIIAAEEDYRCPIAQSEEWFTWLKKFGRVPVDFVRMPGASHGVFASPRQRIARMRLVLEWIERYCPVAS